MVKFSLTVVSDDNNISLAIEGLNALLEINLPAKGEPFPKIAGPLPEEKVCIVGAGPAGIDMAVRLKDKGFKNLIVFEKTGRIGGKSYDTNIDGFYRPQGTVYLTVDYFDNFVELAKRYDVGDLEAIRDNGVSTKTTT